MKKIIVLFGGKSTEHSISLKTGKFIFDTLDRKKYEVKPILITESGIWLIPKNEVHELPSFKSEINYSNQFEKDFRDLGVNEIFLPTSLPGELVFLGLHGGDGENGNIQAYLSLLGIPFTGSGVLASALAMDKEKANLIFLSKGLNVAKFFTITKYFSFQAIEYLKKYDMGFPVFVKPNQGGSSVGAGMAHNPEELEFRLSQVFSLEEKAIVQTLVTGIEVSCGVIEFPIIQNGKTYYIPKALFPTEIVPKSEFFDFQAKYLGKSEEITPARISKELTQTVQAMAILAHESLGCRGYSRTDFIIQDNIPMILETNTLPGMTGASLIPQQVRYEGMSMQDILDILVENALERN
jgi:D-alanine-D-alanine ligase